MIYSDKIRKSTKANGVRIKWKEEEFLDGRMEGCMKEIL